MELLNSIWEKMKAHGSEVPFDKEWKNGTGYFCPEKLPVGVQYTSFCFTDDYGRKAVVLWDSESKSRIVIFQRYTDGENDVVTYNVMWKDKPKDVSPTGPVWHAPYVVDLMTRFNDREGLNKAA